MSQKTKEKRLDPFYVEPLPPAHYHPSPPRHLGRTQKKTVMASLNPEQTSWEELQISKYKSPDEVKFLKAANSYSKTGLPTTAEAEGEERDNSSKFDESWPGSERPSTISIPESDLHLHTKSPRDFLDRTTLQTLLDENSHLLSKGKIAAPTSGGHSSGARSPLGERKHAGTESVLSKYVERFRHGQPMSREERATKSGGNPREFWWLSSPSLTPSDSSTPKDGGGAGRTRARTSANLKDVSNRQEPQNTMELTKANVERTTRVPDSRADAMTRYIQEKADKLLEKTSSTLTSEPAVSTDGLGTQCSSTAPPSVLEEEAYRPGFTRLSEGIGKENIPSLPNPWGSRDDILMQWRRQRRMDLAKENTLIGAGSRLQLGGRSSGVLQTHPEDAEVESKLAEFRRKLGHKSSPLKPSSQLHFTPAPPRSERPDADDTTFVNPCPVEKPNLTTNDTVYKKPTHTHSPIASPHLQRRPLGNKTGSPEPHLHLSCDIIPCPQVDGHLGRHFKEFKDSGCRRLDFESESPSDVDSSFETLKQQHMKKFEEEYRARKQRSKVAEVRGHEDCQEVPERDTDGRGLSKRDGDLGKSKEDRKIAERSQDRKGKRSGRGSSNSHHHQNISQQKPISLIEKKTVETKQDLITSESTLTEVSDFDNADAGAEKPDMEHRAPEHGRQGKQRIEKDGKKEEKKRKKKEDVARKHPPPLPSPKHHSSPKHHLKSAVGEVIQERLFSSLPATSVSLTLTSSIDGSTLAEREADDEQFTQQMEPPASVEEAILSDGEEFPDDDILHNLREKRAVHLRQLQEIDRLLADWRDAGDEVGNQ